MLKAQHLVISGKVRFRILATEGELPDVAQVLLFPRHQQRWRANQICLLRAQQDGGRDAEQYNRRERQQKIPESQ
jgi:hypothetical protein